LQNNQIARRNCIYQQKTTLNICCLKANRIFILGYYYYFVTQVVFLIRSYKVSESYKGKGIVHTTEKMILKEGKKV